MLGKSGLADSEDIADWIEITETDGGWYMEIEHCPGDSTKYFLSSDGVDPYDVARYIATSSDVRALHRSDEECALATEAADKARAAAEEAAAKEAQRCQSVYVEDTDMEVLHPRLTCQGDDLWDRERVTQCAERTVAGSEAPEFACYKIVVGADASHVGSPVGAP